MAHLNWVDNIILLIFVVSIFVGLFRGFIREVLAVITWVAAFFISSMFATRLAAYFASSPKFQATITSAASDSGMSAANSVSLVSVSISFIAIFVTVLIIGSIINYFISYAVDSHGISLTNRLLGAVFGFVRGFLIVLFLIFVIQLSPIQDQAQWAQSRFVAYYQPSVKWLEEMIKPGFENLKKQMEEKIRNTTQQINPS